MTVYRIISLFLLQKGPLNLQYQYSTITLRKLYLHAAPRTARSYCCRIKVLLRFFQRPYSLSRSYLIQKLQTFGIGILNHLFQSIIYQWHCSNFNRFFNTPIELYKGSFIFYKSILKSLIHFFSLIGSIS